MKKFNKKITTIVLTIAMLITAVPALVLATEEILGPDSEHLLSITDSDAPSCYYSGHGQMELEYYYSGNPAPSDYHTYICTIDACDYTYTASHDFSGQDICNSEHTCNICSANFAEGRWHDPVTDESRTNSYEHYLVCDRINQFPGVVCEWEVHGGHMWAETSVTTTHIGSSMFDITHIHGPFCGQCQMQREDYTYSCTAGNYSCDGSCRFAINSIEPETETE